MPKRVVKIIATLCLLGGFLGSEYVNAALGELGSGSKLGGSGSLGGSSGSLSMKRAKRQRSALQKQIRAKNAKNSENSLGAADTELHKKAAAGDNVWLGELSKKVPKAEFLNQKNKNGDTALHIAIQCGHKPFALSLLLLGASSDITNAQGEDPLHLSIRLGKWDIMQDLCFHSDVDQRDGSDQSALEWVFMNPPPDERTTEKVMIALGRANATPNLRNKKTKTNLLNRLAAKEIADVPPQKMEWLLKYMIRHTNPDWLETNKEGDSALHIAAKNKNATFLIAATEGGAPMLSPNKDGDTALLITIRTEQHQLARFMVNTSKPELLNAVNKAGDSALIVAAKQKDAVLIESMLKKGADPKIKNQEGDTALTIAIKQQDNASVAKLANGGGLDTPDAGGNTLLMTAAQNKDVATVKILISAKASVNKSNPNGVTALHLAAGNGDIATMQVLIAAGANVNASSKQGLTPLHSAASGGSADAIKFLVANKANLRETDASGRLPLSYAKTPDLKPLLTPSSSSVTEMEKKEEASVKSAGSSKKWLWLLIPGAIVLWFLFRKKD